MPLKIPEFGEISLNSKTSVSFVFGIFTVTMIVSILLGSRFWSKSLTSIITGSSREYSVASSIGWGVGNDIMVQFGNVILSIISKFLPPSLPSLKAVAGISDSVPFWSII